MANFICECKDYKLLLADVINIFFLLAAKNYFSTNAKYLLNLFAICVKQIW